MTSQKLNKGISCTESGSRQRLRLNRFWDIARTISQGTDFLICNSLSAIEEQNPILPLLTQTEIILGSIPLKTLNFAADFFDFWEEQQPPASPDKLPDFYTQLGISRALPFSRSNKVRYFKQTFRKLILGGKYDQIKLRFLGRRLTLFQEVVLLGQVGLIFALVNFEMEREAADKEREASGVREVFDFFGDKPVFRFVAEFLRFVKGLDSQVNFFVPSNFLVISKEDVGQFLGDAMFKEFLRKQMGLMGYKETALESFFVESGDSEESRFNESQCLYSYILFWILDFLYYIVCMLD